jgi:hypothetical protein
MAKTVPISMVKTKHIMEAYFIIWLSLPEHIVQIGRCRMRVETWVLWKILGNDRLKIALIEEAFCYVQISVHQSILRCLLGLHIGVGVAVCIILMFYTVWLNTLRFGMILLLENWSSRKQIIQKKCLIDMSSLMLCFFWYDPTFPFGISLITNG